MTKKSTPAASTVLACSWVCWGDSEPATGTPAALISAIRAPISSGLIGSA